MNMAAISETTNATCINFIRNEYDSKMPLRKKKGIKDSSKKVTAMIKKKYIDLHSMK